MSEYIILDLDGCIADDRRRLSRIDHALSNPWHHYHEDLMNDPLANQPIVELVRDYSVFVFTARPESYYVKTLEWLAKVAHLIPVSVYMRENGCRLRSPELKRTQLLKAMKDYTLTPNDFIVALDDRMDVLLMYELYGINTLHITLLGYDAAERYKQEVEGEQNGHI